jgi:tyrosine-protein kinase Etk/Wzc
MNEDSATAVLTNQPTSTRQGDVIDLLIILAKHKKLILIVGAVLGLAIALAMPNVYKATTKLLPPQQSQSGAAALLSQLGGVGGSLAGVAGLKNPNDLYVGILKSRTISDKLVQRFELKKVYDEDGFEKTRSKLEENTLIASSKDGLISIDVEDRDPARSAQLANAYAQELLLLTKVLALTEASQRRLFFEQQLKLSKDNLAKAEVKFNSTMGTRGVISVDADSRAILETVGRMRAQIASKEIQLSSMQAFVTPNNIEYKRTQEELNSLRAELSKLQNGRPSIESDAPTDARNQAGLENIQVLRDVKYYQMLYELLSKQYEVARLDEAKDASIIQVLDVALVPERKIKPRRALVILGGLIVSLFGALAWAFFTEGKKAALLEPERAARWKKLRGYF